MKCALGPVVHFHPLMPCPRKSAQDFLKQKAAAKPNLPMTVEECHFEEEIVKEPTMYETLNVDEKNS